MGEIREVWASNLEEEFFKISRLIERYPYVAMDTEFPGFSARSDRSFASPKHQHYRQQSLNVNLHHIIQIGLTLGDCVGHVCAPCCTWQFNFKFSVTEDLHSSNAIELLQRAGIDFTKFDREGIEVIDFAHLLLCSGLVMNDDVIWLTYHGAYDFGYLLKMLSGEANPPTVDEFFMALNVYFPHFYDIKHIIAVTEPGTTGGLSDVGEAMGVSRLGTAHQAG
jgi:CCR4-NOT transcription complex subunit 7/8